MDDLKEYVCKSEKDRRTIASLGAALDILGIVLLSRGNSWIIGLIFVLIGAFLVFEGLSSKKRESKKFDDLKAQRLLDAPAEDFKTAKSFAFDKIRLGDKFIFQNDLMNFTEYKDIKTITIRSSTDFDRNNHPTVSMFLTFNTGKDLRLCGIDSDDCNQLASTIANEIKEKNSDIDIKWT